MEVENKIRNRILSLIVFLSIIFIYACQSSEKDGMPFPIFYPSEHILMTLSPEFTVKTVGDKLHKQYSRLNSGREFAMVGILRVNGKSYRFMGGDSLRVSPLVPLSSDSCGWKSTYSYFHPGEGWVQPEFDDSHWSVGEGAFGTENHYYPTHSIWSVNDVFVRRHFNVIDKESLKKQKLYFRYICDDQMKFYCNGEYAFQVDECIYEIKSKLLTTKDIELLHNGDNLFAAYAHDNGGNALLDFGLYKENKIYNNADTAILKKVDIQSTQTHYKFQCGDVELKLDFVSPALLKEADISGVPVSFVTYQVSTKTGENPDIEIIFDVDMKWIFGDAKGKVQSWKEQNWRIAQSDCLYLAMKTEDANYSYDEGHAVFSRKLCNDNNNSGVLLLGFSEKRAVQYGGENLFPYWNKEGGLGMSDLLKSIGNKYEKLRKECDREDYLYNKKAFQMGSNVYVERMIPFYKSFLATHRFVVTSEEKLLCFGDTLGNIREAYNSFPDLLFFNRIDWMKALLNPVFESCENDYWMKKYPPYDIGIYPIASRQVKIDDCGIEVTADMLLMVAAIVDAEKNFSYANAHWSILCQWGDYLKLGLNKEKIYSGELLNENDERVKRLLGLKAFQKLVQWKEKDV